MVGILEVSTLLPLISLEVREVTFFQLLLAVGLMVVFAIFLLIGHYRLQYVGLTEQQKRHKSFLQGQRAAQTPASVRVTDYQSRHEIEQEIRGLFDRERETTSADQGTTVRAAGRHIIRGLRDSMESAPSKALAFIEEGILLVILGAVVFIPAETWRRYAGWQPDYPSLMDMLLFFRTLISSGADATTSALAAYPYAEFAFAITFSMGVLLAHWLYTHWWLTGLMLITAGVLVWLMGRYLPPEVDDFEVWRGPSGSVYNALLVLFIAWLVGVLVSIVGGYISPVIALLTGEDVQMFFDIGGMWLSLIVLGYFVYVELRVIRGNLSHASDELGDAVRFTPTVVSYLLVHRSAILFAIAMAPFVLLYFFLAVARGQFVAIMGILLFEASLDVQLLVLASILVLAAVIAYVIREEWGNVRTALQEAFSRRRVRLALMNRAMPFGAMFMVYVIAWSFGRSFVFALAAAIMAGIGARITSSLFRRSKYKLKMMETEPLAPTSALVSSYQLLDADGRTHYYTRVNTKPLAHDSLDGIVEYTADAVEDLFNTGDVQPSLATWHADHMFRFGIVDTRDTHDKLVNKLRREVFPRLRKKKGAVPVERLHRHLDRYPADIREKKLHEWRVFGTDDGRLERSGGYYRLVS